MAMYSERTAEEILENMKAVVRDDVDKREGSIVHDMLAPPSQEIEMLGFELDAILELGFIDTSQSEFVDRRAVEQGIIRKEALKAAGLLTFTGNENAVIPIGTRALTEDGAVFITTTYDVITQGSATVEAEAVIAGVAGNVGPAEINAIEGNLAGIKTVTNAAIFDGGVDGETDEVVKGRYLHKVRKPITSGNIYHYELWATEVPGIGAARVYPTWAGAGTVKVVVVSTEGRAPSPAILADVTAHIEEQRPINADVTVLAVKEVPIDVTVNLTLSGSLTAADVQADVERAFNEYLTGAGSLIRYSQIANALLDVDGVLDYSGLKVEGGVDNVTIDAESVAIVGVVALNGGS